MVPARVRDEYGAMGQKLRPTAISAILRDETPANDLSSASGFGTFRSGNQSHFQTLTNGLCVALNYAVAPSGSSMRYGLPEQNRNLLRFHRGDTRRLRNDF